MQKKIRCGVDFRSGFFCNVAPDVPHLYRDATEKVSRPHGRSCSALRRAALWSWYYCFERGLANRAMK